MSAIRTELCNTYTANDIYSKLMYYMDHSEYYNPYYTRNIINFNSLYTVAWEVYNQMVADHVAYGSLFISKNIQFNADDEVDYVKAHTFAGYLAQELGSMGIMKMPVVVAVHDTTDKGTGNYHIHFTLFNYDYNIGGKVTGFATQRFDTLLVATVNTALNVCGLSQCDYRYINSGKIYTPPMAYGIINIPGYVPWRIIA